MTTLCTATDCQAVRERDFRLLADHALDLSPDGLLVESEVDVDVGEDVLVSFRLPPRGIWLDAEARVARVVRGDDGARRIDLRFEQIDRLWWVVLCEVLLDRMIESTA